MDAARFFTHSLQDPRVARILAAGLDAVEPGAVVERYLSSNPLPPAERIYALGVGKAALAMTQALSRQIDTVQALVITKHASTHDLEFATHMESGHPVPDERSQAAGEAALEFVSALEADDLLICLISGGGSALMTAPHVPLDDLGVLTSSLLACGARIDEINTLRRHLDRVKGGGIAKSTRAKILSLILSDVVGDPLEAIASGPTAPDPSTREEALGVLSKYNLNQEVPSSILWTLEGDSDTPKPDDPCFERVRNVIVGGNSMAVRAAMAQANNEGFQVENLGSTWQGEARQVGVELAQKLRVVTKERKSPLCLIAGGETTVTLLGDGSGGRNQELALAAVPELAGLESTLLITLATDGEDGPTDAAGAVVTDETHKRGEALGLDAEEYLSRNDSYSYFCQLEDILRIGPTGTNVNDLTFLFSL